MTIIRSWSGDGLSAGTLDTSTAGTGDTAFNQINNGPFTVTADGARSPRITFPDTAAAHQLRWNGLSLTTWGLRRYFSATAIPASSWSVFQGLDSGGAELFRVEFNSTALLRVRSSSAAVYSPSSPAITAGTVYRIEMIGDSTGAAECHLYEGENTTPLLSSGPVTVTAGTLAEVRWGHQSSVATTGETMDDLAIADTDTFIGAVDPYVPPVDHVIKTWSGSGLSAGSLTSSSAGTGDDPFTSVTGDLTVTVDGYNPARILLPDAAGIKRVNWWPLGAEPYPEYAIRWYMTFGGIPTSEVYLANGLNSGAGSWSVRMTSAGAIRLRDDNAATVRWTSGISVPVGKLVRIELVVPASGNCTLSMYSGHSTTPLASGSGTLAARSIDEARFGFSSSVASNAFTYDTIELRDEGVAIGPDQAPPSNQLWYWLTADGWQPLELELL